VKEKVVVISPDGANRKEVKHMADDVVNLLLDHFSQLGKQNVFVPKGNPVESFTGKREF
jgi:hypothetical protein